MTTNARGRRRLNPVPRSFTLAFARRLERARHRTGMSQRQLALEAGCGTAFIQRLECGQKGAGAWILKRLCLALKVRPDWLLGLGGNEEE